MDNNIDPGSIKIEIMLEDGSIIPGVQVTIFNTDMGFENTTITNDWGIATFKYIIPPGTYTIRATLEGFQEKIYRNLSIKAGESKVIRIEMEVTALREEIDITDLKIRDELEEYIKIPVFYGTNRKRRWSTKPRKFYGRKRGELILGQCWVSIPEDHTMGEIETPNLFKLEFRRNPKKHIVLLEINQLSNEEFLDKLRSNIAQAESKEAVVFIHGFNTTFEEAAQRTAQLAYDLGIETPIMFSWPSRGKLSLKSYIHDETNIEWTVPDLQFFLQEIAEKSGLYGIHLIAHSMGNRALTNVLKTISVESIQGNDAPYYNEVILTAPDIDADTFRNNIAPKIINKAERITLYASSDDKALSFSKTIHGYSRAGDAGKGIVVVEGIDTIDVTPLRTGFWGHSYFAENRDVMNDLFMLLRQSASPRQRNLINKEIDGGRYWCFKK